MKTRNYKTLSGALASVEKQMRDRMGDCALQIEERAPRDPASDPDYILHHYRIRDTLWYPDMSSCIFTIKVRRDPKLGVITYTPDDVQFT